MANIKISELNPLLTVEDADVLPIVDNAVTKKVTAAILRSYTEGNSVLLTGAQTVAGIKTFTAQLASSVATGTAPFSVASTTKVTNLNADLLDGLSSADFQAPLSGTGIVKSTAGTISYLTDNSTNWNTAFNDKINSAAVTGIGTNTLTLTQQDAGTITATWVNGTLIREIRNNTGATLTKGTIVYISGATGNKPTVSKAIATGDSTSAQTFGFVQENILNNANGYVVIIGDLIGVDTSAFTEGDQLYLSSTVAGAFTSTKQYAPNHLVYVGIVTRSHPTLGQIEVNIQNGYELDELHNVAAQSPSNGDILQYVTSTGLWTKIGGTTSAISEGSNLYFTNARSRSAISLTTTGTSGAATYNSTTGVLNVPNYADTDTGITSLNGLTALTQTFAVGTSGTDFGISSATSTHTFNLPTASAANRGALSSADWTTFNNKQNALTNPITGTGTTNYLPKFTGTSALDSSQLFDNGTAIGLGTASPSGLGKTLNLYAVANVNSNIVLEGNDGASFMSILSSATPTIPSTIMTKEGVRFATATNKDATGFSEKMRLTPTGELGIGTTNPSQLLSIEGGASNAWARFTNTTNSGGLYVGTSTTGEAILYQAGNYNLSLFTNATERLTITSAGSVGIGTTSPAAKLDIKGGNAGTLKLDNDNSQYVQLLFEKGSAANSGADFLLDGTGGSFGLRTLAAIPITFSTSASAGAPAERMRITSAGNVGIGTTSANGKLTVKEGATSYELNTTSDYVQQLAFDRTAGLYKIMEFRGSYFVFSPSDVEKMRINALGGLQIAQGLAISGGTAPTSGIEFPSTQVASASANNLDDYEEGTWTMGVSFGGASTGVTYSLNTGNYTKIGRQVTVTGYVTMSNKGSSTGVAKITGLPFTIGNNNNSYTAASFWFATISFVNQYQGYGNINETTIDLRQITSLGVESGIYDTDFANSSRFMVTLTYFV